ncbi:hypothetical protein OIDMADRAFT_207730 [Oidiodendron maius Zn]|uniref:Uncharacterized protein n=1 Tax=Oidiodendron maius (strain Zn) TaxID=913774 RepID=A0A0C3CWP4_OIDMZ|nr:hypothetical protein OIDMADRAFT_207730 [Oidiodendron maius Zn]
MDPNVPIAVIGMSCRFPGDVRDPEDLWKLCAEGRSAWSEIPVSRFSVESVYHPNGEKLSASNVIGGHFLDEDIALFDASFFNLSSEAAASMDPQFRLQLESTYEAMESAGITMQDVAGSNTSVFAGAFFRDYSESHTRDPDTLPRFLLLGVGTAMASNRISHFYDLRGASMTVDTGCSTTLTALHQACQSLRMGESNMSIVGGANIMLNPDNFMVMSCLSLLGKTGKSYAFDHRAEGYGRGEGSATVILKRLDDALRDGDPIRALIRATGVNQDGKTETVTTPSQEAQEELIRACYGRSGLDPSQTAYFEAHGTGTRTGDPIEARAIASVFKDNRPREEPLRIGSVKTNVGHTETASGLASIIKVTLALEKGQIPPTANFEKPNEKIHLDDWNLKVPTQLENWPEGSGIRRASINNFGYGGANAHVIMQDYESFLNSGSHRSIANGVTNGTNGINGVNGHHTKQSRRVILLSAKDEQACRKMATSLREYLDTKQVDDEDKFFASLAYTLGQRRSRFAWVAAHPVKCVSDLVTIIESGGMKPSRTMDGVPRLGYVFTGQGAQWYAMGRELIEAYPVFKSCLMEADRYLKELGATWSLLDELNRGEETSRVNNVALSTPLCVALQIALARLLQSWGITPNAVTSHSSGEMAAACAVGALSLRSTMASVLSRGELAGEMTALAERKGGMIAVGLGAAEAEKFLDQVTSGQLVAACFNSPSSTTISGDASAVEELEGILKSQQIFARRLKVDAAWHSHHVQSIAKPYRSFLERYATPVEGELDSVIYSSPTTGQRMKSLKDISNSQHWVDSLTNPVRFVEAFRNMCFGDNEDESNAVEVDMVIEIGPHGALSGPIHEIMSTLPEFRKSGVDISYLTCLVRKNDAVSTVQALACELARKGYPVDMDAVNFPSGRNKHDVQVLHDLPHYPWNHTTRHWSESRLNQSLRHRQGSPHDLLGSLSLGCNMLSPTWRHVIRISDVPWVRDHTVQTNIVYPGAGYLCMAIEGAHMQVQLQQKQQQTTIRGYRLRDIDILQALVIPESAGGIEVQLTLRPCNVKDLSATGWQEFQICSVTSGDSWLEHCKGLIKVDMQQQQQQHESQRSPPSQTQSDYRIRIDPKDIYANLRAAGIHHGPIFQNLKNIRARNKQSVSTFVVADTATTMPSNYEQPHILHPTTLDTVFQAAYTALPGAGSRTQNSQIPKSVKHVWVAHDIKSNTGHRFNAYTELNRANAQSFEADIVVANEVGNIPVLTVDGFVCQSIGNVTNQEPDCHANEKFITSKWAPDISFIKPAFLKQELNCPINSAEAEILVDLRRLCVYYIKDALCALTAGDVQQLSSHHKKFYVWMKLQVKLANENKLGAGSSLWLPATSRDKATLAAKANAASVNGEMICRLGPHLAKILRCELTPLELMLEDGFLNQYYEDALKLDRSNFQVSHLIKYLAHKNPRAKILEIGAGTGGATKSVLTALGTDDCDGGPLASSYEFTDLSSGFFEAAQDKFKAWKNLVKYKKLDIEQDPEKQGFNESSYDLIVACQVLHATKSMTNTMNNVRKLLKPGGKIILIETTQDQLDVQFAFGLLPGWWLSEEEERIFSPSLSVDMWDRVLHKTGFGGVEIEVHDCNDEELYCFSVIMATADPNPSNFNSDIKLIAQSSTPYEWLDNLKSSIAKSTGITPTIEPIESVHGDSSKVYIFLGELDRPILKSPNSMEFEAIKAFCTKSKGVFWITRGGAMSCEFVDLSLNVGFLRSLRMEYSGKRLAALDLDPNQEPWSLESISAITDVFTKVFDDSANYAINDFEFAYRDGVISIPRFHKDILRNTTVFPNEIKLPTPKMEPFYQPNRSLRLFIGNPGLLDTLAWDDDPDADKDLDADIIEVEPKAFGLNFRDVMVAMGQLNSALMGFECSGYVTRAGSNALAQGFKPGDRVAVLLRGYYGNLARVHWTSVVHIPDDMTFEIAASLPVSYCTAYVSIFDTARLQKGEKILIHAATGAFGQAAIILARHIGAEIYVTVGSEAKRHFIMKTYNIQPDHIFSSRDASFAAGIRAKTRGYGVDVVLNSLAGLLLQESVNCLAPFGRFVEIGKRDLEQNSHLALGPFTRSVSFSSIDLLAYADAKRLEIQQVFKNVISLFHQRVILPVDPITVHPVSELEKAYRLMQAGKHMGKIVIAMKPDDLVPVLPQSHSARLRADCSYLIVGGLGGIGRSVSHWMANHGAKNIIVISRSAGSMDKAASYIAEIENIGCKVKVVGCDISDDVQLTNVLNACGQEMPPIRGVIQAAMVLKDSILERMTLEDYTAGVRPKVLGTWNLHQQLLGKELDFFVMLSSLVGIAGYASQSSYSAGGAFQDALAKYRTMQGLPAVAIDLGQVKSIGYVAETDGTSERLLKQGFTLLSEDDVLSTIEAAILDPLSGQMTVGLNTGPGCHWEEATMSRDSRFTALRNRQSSQNAAANSNKVGSSDLGSKISAAASLEEVVDVIVGGITKKLMDIFMIEESEVQPSKPLSSFGVDSLVAVELRNMLALQASAEVSIFDIMQSSSITSLATTVATKSSNLDLSLIST